MVEKINLLSLKQITLITTGHILVIFVYPLKQSDLTNLYCPIHLWVKEAQELVVHAKQGFFKNY